MGYYRRTILTGHPDFQAFRSPILCGDFAGQFSLTIYHCEELVGRGFVVFPEISMSESVVKLQIEFLLALWKETQADD